MSSWQIELSQMELWFKQEWPPHEPIYLNTMVYICLVIREWHYLRKNRRCGLAGVRVGLLEEVCHWGWDLRFQKAHTRPNIFVYDQDTALNYCSSAMHVTMLHDDNGLRLWDYKQASSKCFLYKGCPGHVASWKQHNSVRQWIIWCAEDQDSWKSVGLLSSI